MKIIPRNCVSTITIRDSAMHFCIQELWVSSSFDPLKKWSPKKADRNGF